MKRITLKQFISDSNIIHRQQYDYSKVVYKNSQTKIEIVCPTHGSFFQLPNNHKIHKQGCPKCAQLVRNKLQTLTTGQFILKAKQIHMSNYNYSNVNYKSYNTKVKIICPLHGAFYQTPMVHLMGCGCQKCKKTSIRNKNRKSLEQFIKDSNNIHQKKYDYSKFEYEKSHKHGKIICHKHGIFLQNPTNHLQGKGCPKCGYNISEPETKFLDYIKLSEENRHKTIKPYKVDGYDPLTNTIYEFLGDYWHGSPKLHESSKIHPRTRITFGEMYNKTMFRLDKLKSLGYNVKYIWESDWNNFKKGIISKLNIITL